MGVVVGEGVLSLEVMVEVGGCNDGEGGRKGENVRDGRACSFLLKT